MNATELSGLLLLVGFAGMAVSIALGMAFEKIDWANKMCAHVLCGFMVVGGSAAFLACGTCVYLFLTR